MDFVLPSGKIVSIVKVSFGRRFAISTRHAFTPGYFTNSTLIIGAGVAVGAIVGVSEGVGVNVMVFVNVGSGVLVCVGVGVDVFAGVTVAVAVGALIVGVCVFVGLGGVLEGTTCNVAVGEGEGAVQALIKLANKSAKTRLVHFLVRKIDEKKGIYITNFPPHKIRISCLYHRFPGSTF